MGTIVTTMIANHRQGLDGPHGRYTTLGFAPLGLQPEAQLLHVLITMRRDLADQYQLGRAYTFALSIDPACSGS